MSMLLEDPTSTSIGLFLMKRPAGSPAMAASDVLILQPRLRPTWQGVHDEVAKGHDVWTGTSACVLWQWTLVAEPDPLDVMSLVPHGKFQEKGRGLVIECMRVAEDELADFASSCRVR